MSDEPEPSDISPLEHSIVWGFMIAVVVVFLAIVLLAVWQWR